MTKIELAITIAADTIEHLRQQDIYRVLDSCDSSIRNDVARHIIKKRPEFISEVATSLGEILQYKSDSSFFAPHIGNRDVSNEGVHSMTQTILHPGDICRTPLDPSGRAEILSSESKDPVDRFRAAAVVRFLEDHPQGYKEGDLGCYFLDELEPIEAP